MLGFDVVPGNIMPVASGAHLQGLARLLNRMMRELGEGGDGRDAAKSPFTSREYVRRNVGSGANTGMGKGPGQQALQMMMKSSAGGAGTMGS